MQEEIKNIIAQLEEAKQSMKRLHDSADDEGVQEYLSLSAENINVAISYLLSLN